ncbi:T9SS type A sorting domain-containing protein [bacterium]|nr:T9SS type A sorting domain-containing protein [bacterium]
MKNPLKFMILCLILLIAFAATATAQSPYPAIINPTASARGLTGNIYYNVDATTEPSPAIISGATLSYSTSVPTFTTVNMTNIGTFGYEYTYETTQNHPATGTLTYYFTTKGSPNWATESPKNTADQWPPNDGLLAQTCNEPTGDLAGGVTDNFMDLTGYYIGYSDTYIYVRLTNAGGGWPTDGGWSGPYYSYAAGITNPDHPEDSIFYALTLVDFLTYGPGLYKQVGTGGGLPSRLGDIDYSTSGNNLYMRCTISSITGDADWGTWPSGIFGGGAQTLKIASLEDFILADGTDGAGFYPHTHTMNLAAANTAPVLTDPGIARLKFTISPDDIFQVTYTDANNNCPTVHNVNIDGSFYILSSSDHSYNDGALFTYDHRVPFDNFYFIFCDGKDTVETEELSVPDAVKARIPEHFLMGNAYPNPFNSKTEISFFADKYYSKLELIISDISGRRVVSRTLETIQPGQNLFYWSPENLNSGVYFYTLRNQDWVSSTGKLLYIK